MALSYEERQKPHRIREKMEEERQQNKDYKAFMKKERKQKRKEEAAKALGPQAGDIYWTIPRAEMSWEELANAEHINEGFWGHPVVVWSRQTKINTVVVSGVRLFNRRRKMTADTSRRSPSRELRSPTDFREASTID